MPFEINLRHLFQDFNPGKFIVYICLLLFCLLFALRQDGTIMWSYWVIFLPLWLWKLLVLVGCTVGSWIWWRHPQFRMEGDSYVSYKAMIISTGVHLLLLMFEVLMCDKLENDRKMVLWILVFIPVFFLSIISIGICVWSLRHERTYEMELFFAVNILQFIFLALRLDGFITWKWVIVFIPIWIVMCVALIGVLYAIILAIILLKSSVVVAGQRRGNLCTALEYTCVVIPLLVFEVLFVNSEDDGGGYTSVQVAIPLLVALFTLALMSIGAKAENQWWFGLRKDFCSWLLGRCPTLQEYGNVYIKRASVDTHERDRQEAAEHQRQQMLQLQRTKKTPPNDQVTTSAAVVLIIDTPD